GDDGAAEILQVQSVRRQLGGIRLDAHRRLLSAADADQAYSGQLRDLRRQPGVGKVFDFGESKSVRAERQGEDRSVGRIDFAVDRRSGKIRRQIRARAVDGLLHFLFRHVDTQAEEELQGD